MNLVLAQFGSDWISLVLWFVIAIIFFFFGQRIMVTQIILKLEKDVLELESMAKKSTNYVIKSVSKKPDKKLRDSINNFMNFFAVSPVSADPYGIIKKIDHVVRNSDQKFTYFVNRIAPSMPKEQQKNIKNALEGAITTNQIAKIVRHYLEQIKKYKMFQLAVVLQMQIPLVSRVAKAAMHATEALADGFPIGDGIGPLVAANMMASPKIYDKYEFAVSKANIAGRNVWVSKAAGPGATTGYPGKFITDFMKKQKIDRIITIDAALRLEGEKTGSIAEGVGVAMGGTGVDRYEIEEIVVKKNIPLDAVVVKVSDEEALEHMSKEIYNSIPKAADNVKDILTRTKKNEKILIMGVGNTCGIGNSKSELKGLEKKIKSRKKPAKKKKGILKL